MTEVRHRLLTASVMIVCNCKHVLENMFLTLQQTYVGLMRKCMQRDLDACVGLY